MSKEILRPCPFCGGKMDFKGAIVTERMATPASAICRICRFRYVTDLMLGNTGKYSPSGFDIESMRKSDEYLLQSVNRRPIEDALKVRIAELEGFIKRHNCEKCDVKEVFSEVCEKCEINLLFCGHLALEGKSEIMFSALQQIADGEWMVDSCAQELAKTTVERITGGES